MSAHSLPVTEKPGADAPGFSLRSDAMFRTEFSQ